MQNILSYREKIAERLGTLGSISNIPMPLVTAKKLSSEFFNTIQISFTGLSREKGLFPIHLLHLHINK